MHMHHSKRAKQNKREGMTLIEITIVVVIMSLIAGAAGFAAMEQSKRARVDVANSEVHSMGSMVEAYLLQHPEADCATIDDLRENRTMSRGSTGDDPWGEPYVIRCDEGEPNVLSLGPDGQQGTEDDISIF